MGEQDQVNEQQDGQAQADTQPLATDGGQQPGDQPGAAAGAGGGDWWLGSRSWRGPSGGRRSSRGSW